MEKVSNLQAIDSIANKEEFSNVSGSLKGYWIYNVNELPRRNKESDIGEYLKNAVDGTFLGICQPAYVVTSYDVPVAYVSGNIKMLTRYKWSATTSIHTRIAKTGLRNI